MMTFHVEKRKVWPHLGHGKDGKKKPVLCHPIAGLTNRILVAQGTGEFIVEYWEEGERRGDDKKRKWRRYPNIWSLARGLRLARASTILKRIPTLQQLQATCADANITLAQRDVKAAALSDVQLKLLRVLDTLRSPRTHALKDVVVQVSCVVPLYDSRGRLNLGALAARLVPVKSRLFCERIADIVGWLGHYAHWEQDVELLLQLAGGQLPHLQDHIDHAIAELSDVARWAGNADRLLRENRTYIDAVTALEPFGGFTHWARACATDLHKVQYGLYHGYRDSALAALRRLQQSVRIKRLQADISDLLLDIQLDRFENKYRLDQYRRRFTVLLKAIEKIDDSDFRHRVVPDLVEHLQSAQRLLPQAFKLFNPGDMINRKLVKEAYDHLRDACNLL